jgi:hypothetical protein
VELCCPVCAAPVSARHRTGRPRRYCTDRCRKVADRLRASTDRARRERQQFEDISAGRITEFWCTADQAAGWLELLDHWPDVG